MTPEELNRRNLHMYESAVNTSDKTSWMERHHGRLTELLQRVQGTTSRLEQQADRLLGPQPAASAVGPPDQDSSSLCDRVSLCTDELQQALNRLASEVERLESL